MFAGKFLISRVQKILFRLLKSYDTTYGKLLSIDSDVSIHQSQKTKKPERKRSSSVFMCSLQVV